MKRRSIFLTTLLLASIPGYSLDAGALATALQADYPLTKVGIAGFKFDYNRITQPGIILTILTPGIYADVANTPQAIISTNVVNGQALQQKGFLASLTNTTQSRTLDMDEQVYVTRLDVKQETVHLELLTVKVTTLGSGSGTRYRAEVRFTIPGLGTMDAKSVEQTLSASLLLPQSAQSSSRQTVPQPGQLQAPPRTPSKPVRPGVAPITPEQEQKIVAQLDRAPASLKGQVAEASETIKPYIGITSCIMDYKGLSQLQAFQGPHKEGGIGPPFINMHYHDSGSCLDVTRFQGWKALSLNAFEFEVVYTAADSGESTARIHQVQKEPDGMWLMNR